MGNDEFEVCLMCYEILFWTILKRRNPGSRDSASVEIRLGNELVLVFCLEKARYHGEMQPRGAELRPQGRIMIHFSSLFNAPMFKKSSMSGMPPPTPQPDPFGPFASQPQPTPPHVSIGQPAQPLIAMKPPIQPRGSVQSVPNLAAPGQFPQTRPVIPSAITPQLGPSIPFASSQQIRPPNPKIQKSKSTTYPVPSPAPRPPKKRSKAQSGKMPTIPLPVNQPSSQVVAVASPPAPASATFAQDKQQLIQKLSDLPDDRAELFFQMFDFQGGKQRHEKMEVFLTVLVPLFLKWNPNATSFLAYFVDQLRLPVEGAKFQNLPLPPFFMRCKNQRQPIYKFIPTNSQGFEIQMPPKDRTCDSICLLGSFLTLGEPIASCPILVDNNGMFPVQFGGYSFHYLIGGDGRLPPRIQVQIPISPPNFLSWFVIQFVERRQLQDVFRELTSGLANADERNVFARTPSCQACLFPLFPALVEISISGTGRCPTCSAMINLHELTLEVADGEAPVCEPQPVPVENALMHQGRLVMAEHLAAIMKFSFEDDGWGADLGRDFDEPAAEPGLIVFDGTEAFIAAIENMR
jgi:hypothetical protein